MNLYNKVIKMLSSVFSSDAGLTATPASPRASTFNTPRFQGFDHRPRLLSSQQLRRADLSLLHQHPLSPASLLCLS